jgi:hypothetical protein
MERWKFKLKTEHRTWEGFDLGSGNDDGQKNREHYCVCRVYVQPVTEYTTQYITQLYNMRMQVVLRQLRTWREENNKTPIKEREGVESESNCCYTEATLETFLVRNPPCLTSVNIMPLRGTDKLHGPEKRVEKYPTRYYQARKYEQPRAPNIASTTILIQLAPTTAQLAVPSSTSP